jgi:hypothetical protein
VKCLTVSIDAPRQNLENRIISSICVDALSRLAFSL